MPAAHQSSSFLSRPPESAPSMIGSCHPPLVDLHPAFDPDCADLVPSDQLSVDPLAAALLRSAQTMEYQMEIELADLRSRDQAKQALDRFTAILIETRNEQKVLSDRFERLLSVLGAP